MREAEASENDISVAVPETDASDSTEATIGEPAADPAPVPDAPEDWETEDDPEAAKRRYLLGRFWHSARAFWSRGGDRLAWPLTVAVLALILLNLGFQYGINVWNRVIFDALEKRDSGTVFFLSAIFLPLAAASVCCGVAQRLWPHDHPTPLAGVAQPAGHRALAAQRPLLPAQSGQRRP